MAMANLARRKAQLFTKTLSSRNPVSLRSTFSIISRSFASSGSDQNDAGVTGSGGYLAAIKASQLGPKTTSILPSKALLRSSDTRFVGEDGGEEEGAMNEFLSRFVWIMRGKLTESFPDCDKEMINGMLLVLVEKVVSVMEQGGSDQGVGSAVSGLSDELSEDLWRTVWEVSNKVLVDMENERKKERMKSFLQCEEVNEMCRFAGQVGIRGEMLRELRFKWAREKMEESDFYEVLERFRVGESAQVKGEMMDNDEGTTGEEKPEAVGLPKRHGKIKYKIYGLDLSSPKWSSVADKIHESGALVLPQEAKPLTGKAKQVMDKILALKEDDVPSPLLAEWAEHLKPERIDWVALLEKVQEQNSNLYFQVAEYLLDESTFEANIYDYSALINIYGEENRIEDVERILNKMTAKGIEPGILTAKTLVHMYGKAGDIRRANVAFEILKSHGKPDLDAYEPMIMAYVNANQPKEAESLLGMVETSTTKFSSLIGSSETEDKERMERIYMALLRSFCKEGDASGVARIAYAMSLGELQLSFEALSCIIEVHGKTGNYEGAENNFNYLRKEGHKPDDHCIASVVAAYEKKNLLDNALEFLLDLEKEGFELGTLTCTVLISWFSKMQLVDEVEQILSNISKMGEAPPLKIHVSLCDMYAKAQMEKKALQSLGILEAREDELEAEDFERVIPGLIAGGFMQEANRMHELMGAKGFKASDDLKRSFTTRRAFSSNIQSNITKPK